MFFFYQYDKYIICEEDFKNLYSGDKTYGFQIKLRLNTYRGLPLSCIEKLKISVDGAEVNVGDVTFCLNGKKFLLFQLNELYSEWWDVLDKAVLQINRIGGLKEGEHKVEVWMRRRGPYMYDGKNYFCFTGHDEKKLLLAK